MNHGIIRQQLLLYIRLQRNAEMSYQNLISFFDEVFPEFNESEIEEEKIRLLVPTSPKNKDYKDY